MLGALGSVSVMAQANVYSLNAVGYINVVCPPGFNIITVPLITSPDNTVGTVLNNASGALTGCDVYFYNAGVYSEDSARNIGGSRTDTTNANGWAQNGTNVASPGVGFWFENNTSGTITNTFVGTVPTGTITNPLASGFNLVGSVLPLPPGADLASNTLSSLTNYNYGDTVYTYNPLNPPSSAYTEFASATPGSRGTVPSYNNSWKAPGDPIIPAVGQGFWYQNNSATLTTLNWVENYSVGQ